MLTYNMTALDTLYIHNYVCMTSSPDQCGVMTSSPVEAHDIIR